MVKYSLPKNNINVNAEMVTPEYAKIMLGTMCKNRNLKPSVVRRYVASILKGQWKINGQCVVISESGVLIDGQHRLNAVVQSNVDVPMLILRGVQDEMELMATIDSGTTRTLRDKITIDGCPVNNIHTATLRSLLNGVGQGNESSQRVKYSDIDLIELYNTHAEAILFSVGVLKNKTKILCAPVCGAIARAFYHVKNDELVRFCSALKNGYPEQTDERPAVLLHSFLLQSDNSGGMAAIEKYKKTQRAIKAFIDKQQITKLLPLNAELFDLPF